MSQAPVAQPSLATSAQGYFLVTYLHSKRAPLTSTGTRTRLLPPPAGSATGTGPDVSLSSYCVFLLRRAWFRRVLLYN